MIRKLALMLATAAVVGCAAQVPPAVAAPNLVGEWRVTAVNGHPVAGKAEIRPPIFNIDFGCNRGRGEARVEGPRLVPSGPFGTTEMACVNADDTPSRVMQLEGEGFRIAVRPMQVAFYGPDRVRLSNEAGAIDLER